MQCFLKKRPGHVAPVTSLPRFASGRRGRRLGAREPPTAAASLGDVPRSGQFVAPKIQMKQKHSKLFHPEWCQIYIYRCILYVYIIPGLNLGQTWGFQTFFSPTKSSTKTVAPRAWRRRPQSFRKVTSFSHRTIWKKDRIMRTTINYIKLKVFF